MGVEVAILTPHLHTPLPFKSIYLQWVCACVCVRASSKLGYPSSPKLNVENIDEDNLVDVGFHICPPVSCQCSV
jgi:hypothetical protein